MSASIPHERLQPSSQERSIIRDVGNRTLQVHDRSNDGLTRLVDRNLEMFGTNEDLYTIAEDNPLSARIRSERMTGLRRGDWEVRIETSSSLSADAGHFHVTNVLHAYEGHVRVFAKTWHVRIPRRLV